MSDPNTSATAVSPAKNPDTFRSVVLPVYDEPPATWSDLTTALLDGDWNEVVLAVDEPDDETQRAAAALDERPDVTLSVARDRRGKGGALRDGLNVASGDVVGYVDADGAVGITALDRLYGAVEDGAAVAIGSRDATAASREGQALHRRVLGAGYRRLARRVTGVDVTDFQCGAKAFRREVWASVADRMDETGFAFDTELLARAHRRGYEVREYPIAWQDPGDSDVSVVRDVPDLFGALRRLDRIPVDASVAADSGDGPPGATADGPPSGNADGAPSAGADPVQIALVTDHPPNRGHLAEYGEELAHAYAGRPDVEVTVLSREAADGTEGNDAEWPYAVEQVWDRDSAATAWRLLRELRTGEYEAVQFNVHMTYFGSRNAHRFLGLSLPALARLSLDCPVVTTLHDMLEVIEEECVEEDVSPLERVGARVATQVALCANATTVTAESYSDVIEQRYLGDAVHVPHGTFTRTDGGVPAVEPPLTLLHFGFLGPTKDVETTIEAFREIRAEIPDAELVVAGGSHPDHPGYRERFEERFGDEPGVRFTGYVEDDDLDAIWHDASLVVMPYHTCTGVSGVFQLAKSYGKPVVAYDNDGMATSTVETGGSAEFVTPEDPDGMAECICDLWADRERLHEMGRENAAAGEAVPMTETAERMLQVFVDHGGLDPARTEVVADD